MLIRKTFNNREEWLNGRSVGIGASEAAACVGMSPFKTALDLWKEKTGRVNHPDLSNNPRVQYGHDAEPLIRGLYLCDHPQYECDYHEFDILSQEERPFLFATLDGELINRYSGERGVLEIKTAQCSKKHDWEKWNGVVPDYYYCQLLHQLAACGEEYRFSNLTAKLVRLNGDSEIRNYEFIREEMQGDIDWLIDQEERFWWYVCNDTMPPLNLI